MSQEAKSMAKSAEMMAGSARAMQTIAEKLEKGGTEVNVLLSGILANLEQEEKTGVLKLIEEKRGYFLIKNLGNMLPMMKKYIQDLPKWQKKQETLLERLIKVSSGKKDTGGMLGPGGKPDSAAGSIGKLAGGLGELAKILPTLAKGLIGFPDWKKSSRFTQFVFHLRDSIGQDTKSMKTNYEGFGKAMDSLAHGISKMSWGLFWFQKLTTDKGNNRFLEFVSDIGHKMSKLDAKKIKAGADSIKTVAESILLLGLSLAVSTVLFAVGAVGSLIIVPVILGYSLLFEYLGKNGKNIKKGAESVAWMGLGILSMAVGIFAAGQLAGGWKDFIIGSLIVGGAIALFALEFDLIGKAESAIQKGAEALIFTGVAIASLALGIYVMQLVAPNIGTVLVTAAAVALVGLAFGLIGEAASDIIEGSAAIAVAGLAVIVLGLSLWTVGKLVSWEDMAKAGVAVLGFGILMAVAGVASEFIIPGAIAIALSGVAVFALGLGLTQFKDTGITWDELEIAGAAVLGFGMVFAAAGAASILIVPGSVAIALAGLALVPLALGLNAMAPVWKNAAGLLGPSGDKRSILLGGGAKSNLEAMVDSIVWAFTGAGAGSALLFAGSTALMYASAAMAALPDGLLKMGDVWKGTISGGLFSDSGVGRGGFLSKIPGLGSILGNKSNLELIIDGIVMSFASAAAASIGGFFEKGAKALMWAGGALINIADGLSKFAEMTKTIDVVKVGESTKSVMIAVGGALAEVGKGNGDTSWWRKTDAELGAKIIMGIGGTLSGLADGVSKMAQLKFPIYDEKTGKITGYYQVQDKDFLAVGENIKSIMVAIGGGLAAVGKGNGDTSWFRSTDAELGAKIIGGIGGTIGSLVDTVIKISQMKIPAVDKDGNIIKDKWVLAPSTIFTTAGENIKTIIKTIGEALGSIGKDPDGNTVIKIKDVKKGKDAIMGIADDIGKMVTTIGAVSKIPGSMAGIIWRLKAIVTAFPQAIVDAANIITNSKVDFPTILKQLKDVPGPLSSMVDVMINFEKVKSKTAATLGNAVSSVLNALSTNPVSTDALASLKLTTEYIGKLATSADAIDKLASAFGKLSKSIDVFAGAFKKMDKDVLQNSDMLIQSFVLFAKVDPAAFETNGVKGKALMDYVYDKVKPVVPVTPATTPTVPDIPKIPSPIGVKPVDPKSTKADAEESHRKAMQDIQDATTKALATMSQQLDAIKQALTSPAGLRVRQA